MFFFLKYWTSYGIFWCGIFFDKGKGPEKEKYEAKIKRLKLKRVAFRTMWLSADDYPLLLGIVFLILKVILYSGEILHLTVFGHFRISWSRCLSAYFIIRIRPSNEGIRYYMSVYKENVFTWLYWNPPCNNLLFWII